MRVDFIFRLTLGFICFGVTLLPSAGSAQSTSARGSSVSRSFHGGARSVRRSVGADGEALNIFRQVFAAAGLVGMEDRVRLRASQEVPNAEAGLDEADQPYVDFNPSFMQAIVSRTDNYWSLVAILAHEVGHIVRRHTDVDGRYHEFELEADYTAGYILHRMGATVDEAQAVYRTFPEAETDTHPGRARRLQSVALGWSQGTREPQVPRNAPAPGQAGKPQCSGDQVRRIDGVCVAKDPATPLPRAGGPKPLSRAEEAAVKPLQTFRECVECPELVAVSPGVMALGTEPSSRVRIAKRLAVGRYEITFAQWDACVAERACKHVPDDAGWGRRDRPAIKVSWNDAKTEYLPWLARKTGKPYRLPTEAEWHYVAAAGGTTAFTWGDDLIRGQANCAACGSPWDNRQSAPVGSFAANAFGLFDVHGNVWEWVEDCVAPNYPRLPADGRAATGEAGCFRGLRGGSWDNDVGLVQLTARGRNRANLRSHSVGFRVVRSLD